MAGNYLIPSRHGTLLYFRRRVPDDLRSIIGKPYLVKSLGTGRRREAIILARAYAAHTDDLFQRLRTMPHDHDEDGINIDFGFKLDLNELGRVTSITVTDAKPEEQDAINSAIETALKNLPVAAPVQPTPPTRPVGLPLGDAIEQYLNSGQIKPTTRKTYRTRLARAIDYFGETKDARHIEQAEFSAYARHALSAVPGETTAKLCVSTFAGVLNHYRINEGWGPELTTKKLLPKKSTPDTADRDGYTLAQLAVVFENARRFRQTEPAKYWVTIATALTGCRIEELAEIELPHDLHHDTETGVWYLDLSERPDADGAVRKSMKNPASWRRLPLHSALVQHGFVSYLQDQVKKGFTRPFECEWGAYCEDDEDGIEFKWSHYISGWGGRELKKLDKNGLIKKGKLGYFHSMRHTFSQVMDDAGIAPEVTEAALGHKLGRGDRERYNKMKTKPALLSREGIEPGLTALVALLEPPQA